MSLTIDDESVPRADALDSARLINAVVEVNSRPASAVYNQLVCCSTMPCTLQLMPNSFDSAAVAVAVVAADSALYCICKLLWPTLPPETAT